MSPPTELSPEEISRYARHILLEEVGREGQLRLKQARVLVVGAGGLGSPVLLYLAAAGVGRIGVVDFDTVDCSNLQRQVLHSTSDVGRPKVESARARVEAINPHIQVDVYELALSADNVMGVLEGYDIVVDGTDNFPTRYLVNDACVLLGKPYVYGSIFKFEGQASVFNHRGGPNYRDLYPKPPPPGAVPSCAEGGVLGILPGVIGMIQATEVVKIILDLGEILSGRLLLYDALSMRFREIQLRPDPSAEPIRELIDYEGFCGLQTSEASEMTASFSNISVVELKRRLDAGWEPFVLDVRASGEAAVAKLDFSDRLHPHSRVLELVDELPRDRDIVVHCKRGGRSATACAALAGAGFDRLYNLQGGIIAWSEEIDPSVALY
jgi:adenylyltransferase/sulfurtransferase